MFKRFLKSIWRWLRTPFVRVEPTLRGVVYFEGDELPNIIPSFDVAVARESDGTLWIAAMICPCGCGDRLEVMLLEGVKPRWDLAVNAHGYVTLHPSIWRNTACGAHFRLIEGRVIWC